MPKTLAPDICCEILCVQVSKVIVGFSHTDVYPGVNRICYRVGIMQQNIQGLTVHRRQGSIWTKIPSIPQPELLQVLQSSSFPQNVNVSTLGWCPFL